MSQLLDEARRLEALGYRLVPLRGKAPTIDAWQTRKLSLDELAPELATATGLGHISSAALSVLDLDGTGWRGVYALLEEEFPELEDAPTVRTGKGRRHCHFRCADMPESFTSRKFSRPDLDCVVELRGHRSNNAVPPSIHPETGNAYTWEKDPELYTLPEIPFRRIHDFLEAWAGKPADEHGKAPPVEGAILDGTRDTTLTSFAGAMRRRGMSEGAILAALLLENRTRCVPPLAEAQVEKIARSIGKLHPAEVPALAPAKLMTLEELVALPPPAWLVEDFLIRGSLAVLYGAPATGKSFLALDLALSVASGSEWHGATVAAGRAVYCCGEGIGGFADRIRAWRHDAIEACAGALLILPAVPRLLDGGNVAGLLVALKALDPPAVLVVVDTLARALAGGDENSAEDVGAGIEALDRIRQATGAATLLVHHSGKDATRGARGSSCLLGAADTMIGVDMAERVLRVVVEKQKDAPTARPLSLVLETVQLDSGRSSCQLRRRSVVEEAAERGKVSEALVRLLREPAHRGDGLTAIEGAKLLKISRSTFYEAVNPLIEEGAVRKEGSRFTLNLSGCPAVSDELSDMSPGCPVMVSGGVSYRDTPDTGTEDTGQDGLSGHVRRGGTREPGEEG